jgi:hypothetical protein
LQAAVTDGDDEQSIAKRLEELQKRKAEREARKKAREEGGGAPE